MVPIAAEDTTAVIAGPLLNFPVREYAISINHCPAPVADRKAPKITKEAT
jgi:hypothetical protein